jgi:acetyl esterase/lipase
VIPADAPPAFLLCANDEYGCDETTVDLLRKFRAAKMPVEAHMLAQGKHGFNLGDRSPFASVKHWPQRMADWLDDRGFLRPAIAAGRGAATPD